MVLAQFEPAESKCQKWLTIVKWKREVASFFFQVIQWLANEWIIGQGCFYHLPLNEWMTYYQCRGEKRVQRSSFLLLVLRLSSFAKAAWVELILWTNVLPHIVSIESHLLDFTPAFSLIWWISHVSIVTSFITWSILTNCFSLITRLLSQKILIQYHLGRKRTVPMSRLSKLKNQLELIDNHGEQLADYQMMRKWYVYGAMQGKEIFYIYIVILSILCFRHPKVVKEMYFLLEVIKIIPANQLMLCLICSFN